MPALSPLPQLTVQSRSLDHLLVYHLSRLNRGVQLFGSDRVEGVLLFFCLLFTHLTTVAQFRPNVRARGYVSCTSFCPHWCAYTPMLLQLVSSQLENTLEISPVLVSVTFLVLYLPQSSPVISPPPTWQSCMSRTGSWNIQVIQVYTWLAFGAGRFVVESWGS